MLDLQFNVTAKDLLANVNRNTKQTHAALENLARLFPAHADSSEELSPFLTVPAFESFAQTARAMTGARLIAYTPFIVDEEARNQWESYSIAEQSWTTSAAVMPGSNVATTKNINPHIWIRDATGSDISDPGPAPYAPIWQVSPPPSDTKFINYNLASDRGVEDWISLQFEQNATWSFLSQPVDASSIFGNENYSENDMSGEPTSLAWIPVEETLLSSTERVSGAIVADIPWTALLRNVSLIMKFGKIAEMIGEKI